MNKRGGCSIWNSSGKVRKLTIITMYIVLYNIVTFYLHFLLVTCCRLILLSRTFTETKACTVVKRELNLFFIQVIIECWIIWNIIWYRKMSRLLNLLLKLFSYSSVLFKLHQLMKTLPLKWVEKHLEKQRNTVYIGKR